VQLTRLTLFLFIASVASGQILRNHYIVELSTAPVGEFAARQNRTLKGLTRDAQLQSHQSSIRAEQQRARANIEQRGAQVLDSFELVRNALVVRMTPQTAAAVAQMGGVVRVRPVRMYRPLLDHALPLQKVPDAWQQIGGMDKAGAGVKIAIIDTGIDVTHPAFQGFTAPVPAGFPIVNKDSDLAYTNSKVIVARSYSNPANGRSYSAQDQDGHGTGVAMVAAGLSNSAPNAVITGVAPQAWLGSYKVFPSSAGAPDSLIIRGLEDAVADGMDIINLSLGGTPAPRPSDDELVAAVETAAAAGKIITIAAGNDGGEPNTIGSPGTAPSAISVGSSENDRKFAGSASVNGTSYAAVPGDGNNPSQPVSGTLVDVSQADSTGEACSTLPAGSLAGKIALILRGDCFFSDKLTNAATAGAVAAIIYSRPENPGTISWTAGGSTLPAVLVSNSDGQQFKQAAGGGPAQVTIDFTPHAFPADPAQMSGYSSRGPNPDLIVKPDMLAVGSNISTAKPMSSGGYAVESGTSFSAPTVAGAAALLMGARPGLTAQQYRSLLVNSAGVFLTDGTNPAPVLSAGTGLLNMTATLASTIAVTPVSFSFGAGNGTIDQTRTLTITNVGSTADTFSISAQALGDGPVPSVSTSSVQIPAGDSKNVQIEFAASALGGGAYQGYLQIQGTQSTVSARVPYWYAVPTGAPTIVQVFSPPSTSRAGATIQLAFRFLDADGLPITDGVDESVLAGGTVLSLDADDIDAPGLFIARVRLPRTASGPTTIHIQLGAAGTDVSITVN
jgi:subtilisin family serine protease